MRESDSKMQFDWSHIGKSFVRSLAPVAVTYSAAIAGIELFGNNIPIQMDAGAAAVGLFMVPLFTLTHAVVPVFFYRIFLGPIESATVKIEGSKLEKLTNVPAGCLFSIIFVIRNFVYFHMGFWFGIPSLALAITTGWLTIPAAVIHIALARKGTRTWVFLQYGSTSMALLLFLMMFSGKKLLPDGILVVMFQIFLLTIVDWKGRGLWVKEPEKDKPEILLETVKDL